MVRVIYINQMAPGSRDSDSLYALGTDAYYSFGLAQFIIREFVKRGYDIQCESWRSDPRQIESVTKTVNGVICRVFPSYVLPGPMKEFSFSLLRAIIKQSSVPGTIVHFMGTHALKYHIYSLFLRNVRIFATHLGDPDPLWRFNNGGGWRHLLFFLAEKHVFLKQYTCFFNICAQEHMYYLNMGKRANIRVVLGVSRLENFVIKPRHECRERLGLPHDKQIILQVGRAVKYRGFEWMIEAIDALRERSDLLFVFLNVKQETSYYDELVDRNCIVRGHVSIDELVDYYNAANLHWFFYSEIKQYLFGGTAYVPVEALVCGTPTITNSFHHISGSGIESVSRIPKHKSEIVPMINELLANPPERETCRQVALNIFSWDKVLEDYWRDYNEA